MRAYILQRSTSNLNQRPIAFVERALFPSTHTNHICTSRPSISQTSGGESLRLNPTVRARREHAADVAETGVIVIVLTRHLARTSPFALLLLLLDRLLGLGRPLRLGRHLCLGRPLRLRRPLHLRRFLGMLVIQMPHVRVLAHDHAGAPWLLAHKRLLRLQVRARDVEVALLLRGTKVLVAKRDDAPAVA
ncbi:hypothetical protein PENSPDRAFT_246510 [Peniophora sp. CONT]|nr:hypothetical protein PENSPDRAFT_246510 [Peniophora sp. CONT]